MAVIGVERREMLPMLRAWAQLTGLWWLAFILGVVAIALSVWSAFVLSAAAAALGAAVVTGRVTTPWPRGGLATGLISLAALFLLLGVATVGSGPVADPDALAGVNSATMLVERSGTQPASPPSSPAPTRGEARAAATEPAKEVGTDSPWFSHDEWSEKLAAIEEAMAKRRWERALTLHAQLPPEAAEIPNPEVLEEIDLDARAARALVKRYRQSLKAIESKTAAIFDDTYEALWGAKDPDAVNEDLAVARVARKHRVSEEQVDDIWLGNQSEVMRRLAEKSLRQDRQRTRQATPRGPHIKTGYALGCVSQELHDAAIRVAAAGGDPRSVRGCVHLGENTAVSLVGSAGVFASLVRVRLANGREFWTATENVAK